MMPMVPNNRVFKGSFPANHFRGAIERLAAAAALLQGALTELPSGPQFEVVQISK